MWIGNKNKATCRDGLYPRVCLANLCNWLNHNTKAAKRDLHHLVFKAVLWLFFPMLESQKKTFDLLLPQVSHLKTLPQESPFFGISYNTLWQRDIFCYLKPFEFCANLRLISPQLWASFWQSRWRLFIASFDPAWQINEEKNFYDCGSHGLKLGNEVKGNGLSCLAPSSFSWLVVHKFSLSKKPR